MIIFSYNHLINNIYLHILFKKLSKYVNQKTINFRLLDKDFYLSDWVNIDLLYYLFVVNFKTKKKKKFFFFLILTLINNISIYQIGEFKINLCDIENTDDKRYLDRWYDLRNEEGKSDGRVHIILEIHD